MCRLSTFAWSFLTSSVLFVQTVLGCASQTATEPMQWENASTFTGMYFSTASVVEEYELDGAFCIKYTNADANCDELEIHLIEQSYHEVLDAIMYGRVLTGTLKADEEHPQVFEVVWTAEEDDFRINTCSYAREYEEAMQALAKLREHSK